MAGWWFWHKTRTEKAAKFGMNGAIATRSVYVAPRPGRHLPTQCRPGWACGERAIKRAGLGRKHLLARPVKGLSPQSQKVVAQLLPSVPVGGGNSPASVFENATDSVPVGANEFVVGISEVRRVRIEETGVIALERTRCTQTASGVRIVTLFWAIYVATENNLRMARICAEGEAELRTYRTQVADFLRRWTASGPVAFRQKTILLR